MSIKANGLCRRIGGKQLLDNICLSVSGGNRIVLTGPTGSGKTLLLRSLAMLDPIDSGVIQWRGKSISGNMVPAYRSQVVYLHQRPSLGEGTVEENLRLPFTFEVHKQRHFDRQQIVRWLKSLGRPESFLSKTESELSGGEIQLAVLLRAIQLSPYILLLDEPTAALDAQTTTLFESLVESWHNECPDQRVTIWVTHDPQQAARIASTRMELENGKLKVTR